MKGALGALLRRHRVAAGLTQEALAERAGLSGQAVAALERGSRRFPHRHTVDRLIEALALSDDDRDQFVVAATRPRVPRARVEGIAPRQLPPDIAYFTGRGDAVDSMLRLLGDTSAGGILAIAGMAGVGKTSLALHVAHRAAEWFPDGQVYLDLRGAAAPLSAQQAIGAVLRLIGVPNDDVPTDLAEASASLRTRLADQRMLLVLDNAAHAEQLAPLLPGTGASAAIVTSRRELSDLPQLSVLRLDLLPEPEAVALLGALAGPDRVAAEPDAAAAVVRSCGYLPLAVRLTGARLATRPGWSLAQMAQRLADERGRLDELQRDDVGVRASFAVSVDQLDEPDATAFALLGLSDGPVVTVTMASRLFDVPEREAEQILDHLADQHLLQPQTPGRYRLHDLLHDYAREKAHDTIGEADSAAAMSRLLDLLVAVSWRGQRLAAPTGVRGSWAAEEWERGAPDFASSAEAFAWLDEHRDLLTLVASAPGIAAEQVVRFGIGLFLYFLDRRHLPERLELAELTYAAAGETNDLLAQALARMDLGIARADQAISSGTEVDEAYGHLERSVSEFEALGDKRALAMALINVGDIHERASDFPGAIRYNERALAITEETGDFPGGEAIALINLGGLYGRLGDREMELSHYRRSLPLLEQDQFSIGYADVQRRIGIVHHALGHDDEARAALQASVDSCRRHGYPLNEAAAHHELATILHAQGQQSKAEEHWQTAVVLYEEHGHFSAAHESRRQLFRSATQSAAGG